MPTPSGIGLDDLNDPTLDPGLLNAIKTSPALMALLRNGKSGVEDVAYNNQTITVTNGRVTKIAGGSAKGPLLAAAAVGTAGILAPYAAAALSGDAAATSTVGPTTAASMAATTAASAAPPSIAAAGGAVGTTAAGLGGLSYADMLKYGLPVAGNLVGNVIQSKAAGEASDAQQKYLEEALAYEKEKDLYQRTTDAAHYADTRGDLAASLARDETRYEGYQGRIAPFIATGTSSNARMAALLGLPAPAGGSSGGGNGGGSSSGASSSGGTAGVPVSADISAANLANYKALGVSPTGRGTGPTDSAYYDEQIAATGGLTDANKAYWFGPGGRIALDMQKAGVKATPGAVSPTTAPTTPPGATPGFVSDPVTTQPQARTAAMVQMRAPDGSVQSVSAEDVAHFQSRGATLASTQTVPTSSTPPSGGGGMVTMRAPDGSTNTVRADQVAHYQSLGATLLGAAA
jgi:hypothetical protein